MTGDIPARPMPTSLLMPSAELYPELKTVSGLAAAIREQAASMGLDLEIRAPETGREQLLCATIPTGRGRFEVNIGAVERWFLVRVWWRGVQMFSGKTRDLSAVVGAAECWRAGANLDELRMAWPFVTVPRIALAHEAGDEVAMQWQILLSQHGTPAFPLVQAAYADPRLRVLFPFTSHYDLHFSRCTGFPYSWDVPFIQHLPGGRYLVAGPLNGTVIGEADDAVAAIVMVTANLPAGCGPAVPGTADDSAQE